MPSNRVRRHVIVHGRVQGVFFRDSLRERARTAGVAGGARNLPDGTVEAIFEGPLEAVERLVRFCETRTAAGARGPDRRCGSRSRRG